ncbi:MAG: MlaD family protein [Rubricoccaceae bacterium]|nr:MlaD family protein [Rubricoccaceae bacterium]
MSRQARLGLVVLSGVVLFVLALFVLANRTFLLSDTYAIRAEFEAVGGLQPGATVYYQGISVGRVDQVLLPEAPGLPITVTMRIRDDARNLIREDSRAVIQTDGLVGNVVVSIQGGTPSQPAAADNARIAGRDPLDFSEVSDRLFDSVARFDSVTVGLTTMMQDVRTGEGTLGRFLYDPRLYEETVLTTASFRGALESFTGRADALVAIAADASAGVNEVIQRLYTGDGTVARFLNDDSMYVALLQASEQLTTISTDIRSITERFETAAGWGAVGAFRFAENMEALKHNFLFKPYFEERGYLEMAPFEIRERALAETYQSLQEWERRLYQQQQEIEALRTAMEAQGVAVPPALDVGTAPLPPPEADTRPGPSGSGPSGSGPSGSR